MKAETNSRAAAPAGTPLPSMYDKAAHQLFISTDNGARNAYSYARAWREVSSNFRSAGLNVRVSVIRSS